MVILGSGESGVGSAILAKQKGYEVFVSDKGNIKDKYKQPLQEHNITFEEGKHSEELVLNATEVIKSPGIPEKTELVVSNFTARSSRLKEVNEIVFFGFPTILKEVLYSPNLLNKSALINTQGCQNVLFNIKSTSIVFGANCFS